MPGPEPRFYKGEDGDSRGHTAGLSEHICTTGTQHESLDCKSSNLSTSSCVKQLLVMILKQTQKVAY